MMMRMSRRFYVAAAFSLVGAVLSIQDVTAREEVAEADRESSAPAPVVENKVPAGVQESGSGETPAVPAPPAAKVVYKSVDSKGKIIFTDSPPAGRASEAIKVQATNTVSIGASSPSAQGNAEENSSDKKNKFVKYTKFVISSPVNDEVLGQDVDTVTLAAELEPSLQKGHTAQLYYDGNPVGAGELFYSVTNLERGTHTVEAKVFDSNKRLLMSSGITQFHVRRISSLNKLTASVLSSGNNGPGAPTGGFGGPKGAGSLGGASGAREAGSLNGANSAGDAGSARDVAPVKKGK